MPGTGISVEGQFNLISENYINNCGGAGIELSNSSNTISANTISNSGCGIEVDQGSNSNTISRNLLNANNFDIQMYGDNNTVVDNTITSVASVDNSLGIVFYDPANANTVSKNDITNNYEAIGLDKQVNYFYLNNLINNTYDVRFEVFNDSYVPYSLNVFDNGSMGNYWSDYKAKYPNAKEIDNTGIYNTSYVVDGNITDNYPLATPYIIGSTGAQLSTGSANPTLSPTPTSSPAVPEVSWLMLLPLLLVMVAVAVIVRHRKTTHSKQ